MIKSRRAMAVPLAALGAAMTAVQPADAAVVPLASYPFTGNSAASTDTETSTTASAVTFGPFTNGTGTATLTTSQMRAPTNTTGIAGPDADTLAEAIAQGTYATFTLQTNGVPTDLSSLTFNHGFQDALVGTSATVAVLTNLTGFGAGDALASYTFAGVAGNTAPIPRSVDLTTQPLLQNLTGSVEVRLYFYDNSDTGSRYTIVDDLTLNGVVPEPAMLGVFGSAFVGLLARRRRHL